MDRRTIIFLISVSISFFLINLYFQGENRETLRTWEEQQSVKKEQLVKKLETEISEKTIKPESLPLVQLYADAAGEQLITTGFKEKQMILTLSWNGEPPQKVFVKSADSSASPEEYYLLSAPEAAGKPILFHKGIPGKLTIGDLPDFGSYDLQLVMFFPGDKETPARTTPASYTDGHFTIPLEKLITLKKELGKEENPLVLTNSLVMMKSASGYLPVASYDASTKAIAYLEDVEALAPLISLQPTTAPKVTAPTAQKFYVLENNFQQIVFSNVGGAIAEINLPFETKENKESVVKEIPFDREIVKNHPYNAHFPSHPFYTPTQSATGPYNDQIEGKLGGYYPLLRRDLIEAKNKKSIKTPPRFYATNIVSEYPEMAELVYDVKEFTKEKIVFEAIQNQRRITKTYSLAAESKGAPYCLTLTIEIEGDSRGLWLTSGVPEVEWISGAPAPVLKYRITRNGKPSVETIDLPKDASTNTSIVPDWIANSNGFLGIILNPISDIGAGYRAQYVAGTTVPSRLVEIDQEYQIYKAQDMPGYMLMTPLSPKGGKMDFVIYAGPFEDDVLKAVDAHYSDSETGYNPDFIATQTFHGWFSFISEPFAKILFFLMRLFYSVTGSWAFSIVLLTVALRLMLYPLNAWSMKSMVKMQAIAPEVTALQEKYKKDPKKLQVEIMNLYRDRGVNPMSGCLPLLIQMPFLIGMFDLLKSTFELRGASFIPGWIDDLASPDVLFSWNYPIFFIGNQFHLLPIILGLVMFIQQRISTTLPKDPNLWTEQQRQQRTMGTMMTAVFAVMFYHFPSGLNIYWLSSMILGIIQQWWTQKSMKAKA